MGRLGLYEQDYTQYQEFEHHHCYDYQKPVRTSTAPDVCDAHYFSIGADVENRAIGKFLGNILIQSPFNSECIQ